MKNILTIIKKEFSRFFKDKRMVITTLLLPGLMIYLVYSFMGSGIASQFEGDDDYVPTIMVINQPDSFEAIMDNVMMPVTITPIDANQLDEAKQAVIDGSLDMVMVFEADFDDKVALYDPQEMNDPAPHVALFYRSTSTESQIIYSKIITLLNLYETSLSNRFDMNRDEETYDLASDQELSGTIFAMLLPFLVLVFLFSGCMAIAPESIAGEKERGTIATLLITPIKRSELAIGKIVSLSFISMLGAISSFLGTVLSLPKLMGGDMGGITTDFYSFGDYAALLIVIITTVLVMIGIIANLSAFAKSVKEATTLIAPLMIFIMVIGVSSMFGGGTTNSMLYLIPIYNSVQLMGDIFSFNFSLLPLILTVVSNIIVASIFIFVLTHMFNNEKVMFSK